MWAQGVVVKGVAAFDAMETEVFGSIKTFDATTSLTLQVLVNH